MASEHSCAHHHVLAWQRAQQRAEAGARAVSNAEEGSLGSFAGALTVGLENARLAPHLPCTAALSSATHVWTTAVL